MNFIKKEEVAEILQIRPITLLKMVQANEIPHYKLGYRTLRFLQSEIEEWAISKKNQPISRPVSLLRRCR